MTHKSKWTAYTIASTYISEQKILNRLTKSSTTRKHTVVHIRQAFPCTNFQYLIHFDVKVNGIYQIVEVSH